MSDQEPRYACSRCGGPARIEYRSLDSRWPIGRCRPLDPEAAGCGRVALLTDPAAITATQVRWHRKRMTAQHFRHDPDHRTSASCDKCIAAGWVTARTDPGTVTAGT